MRPSASPANRLKVCLHLRQHREATGDVEAADHNLNAGFAERAGDVEGAWELVRLHAHQTDHAEAAVAPQQCRDLSDLHACVGFVECGNVDRLIWTKHVAFRRIGGKGVQDRKRIRRDRRTQPLHDIAVIIVVRRL
jgi:hypothetical protein